MQQKNYEVLFLGADSTDYLDTLTLCGLKKFPNLDLYTYPEPNLLSEKRRNPYQEILRSKVSRAYNNIKKQIITKCRSIF